MTSPFDAGGRRPRPARPDRAARPGRPSSARTLTPPLVDALWGTRPDAYMNVPDAGGCEPSFVEVIDTWIELAWQDGSLGWVGIANLPSAMAASAYLPDAGLRRGVRRQSRPGTAVTVGGQFFPNGTGVATDDGYLRVGGVELRVGHRPLRVRGRRVLPGRRRRGRASTSARSAWPSCRERGQLRRRLARAGPAGHRELRLLGSHDVFVPEHRCFRPVHPHAEARLEPAVPAWA